MNRNQMANEVLAHNAMWHRSLMTNEAGELVNNAGTLRYEDFQSIQEELVRIRRLSLNGVTDLLSAGLRFDADITQMLAGYENINEFQEAKVSMNPSALQDNVTDFVPAWVPLPIVHQSWRIPFRQMGFAYKNQIGMSESVRQVSEKLEDMLFNGNSDIVVDFNGTSQVIYGYTTHPSRQTLSIADWTDPANRTTIISNAIAMISLMFTNAKTEAAPNGLTLYVATDIWANLEEDYSTTKGDRTIRERLLAIPEIGSIKPSVKLTAGNVAMVEMSNRTVQMAVASDVVTVPHIRDSDIADQVFTTYAAMVPQIKSDRNSRTGIVHGSP